MSESISDGLKYFQKVELPKMILPYFKDWISHMKMYSFSGVSIPENEFLAERLQQLIDIHGVIGLPLPLLSLVDERIMSLGASCYLEYLQGCAPDHVWSEEAFAYYLMCGGILHEQAKRIRFDHGDNFYTFTRQADGLLQKVLLRLATVQPKKEIVVKPDLIPHPCCNCCH